MPLVGASPVYRPPVAGEPLRLREDGHWSTDGLVYLAMGSQVPGFSCEYVMGAHLTGAGATVSAYSVGGIPMFKQTAASLASPAIDVPIPTQGTWLVSPATTYATLPGGFKRPRIGYYGGGYYHFMDRDALIQMYSGGVGAAGSIGGVSWINGAPTVKVWLDGVLYAEREYVIGFYGNFTSIGASTCCWQILYRRALSADEHAALHAYPDLPIWRPRRGISLAMLTETATGRIRYPWHTPGFNAGFGRL